MAHPLMIQIDTDGEATLVYHPDTQGAEADALTQGLGTIQKEQRAGHVYPQLPILRAAFRLLRQIFGGGGRVADWTRTWGCCWIVRLVESGDLLPGSYASHKAATDAEILWILEDKEIGQ